MRFSEIISYCT